MFVCHLCPRYPVYFFKLQVADDTGQCEARVWILNETVCDQHDPFESDFWTGERLERAQTIASDTLNDNGLKIVKVIEQFPCGSDEAGDEAKFYDEAEAEGLCVVDRPQRREPVGKSGRSLRGRKNETPAAGAFGHISKTIPLVPNTNREF